jgi:ATP-dependent Lon protease
MFKDLTVDAKDYDSNKAWLEYALALPYDSLVKYDLPSNSGGINDFCVRLKRNLDKKVFGLETAKQELMQIMINRITNPKGNNVNLALCSPPGLGKSLIFSTIAETLGIPFERISIGGLTDAAVLKGHSSTYIGSEPGLIVQLLKRVRCSNALVFIDEIDKLGETERGREVQYALLHITDATTNKEFRDTYLSDIPLDLSRLWFVFAMNNDRWIDKALKDRLHVVKLKNYSRSEKESIVKSYLLPQAVEEVGMKIEDVSISADALSALVRSMDQDAGIRPLKEEVRLLVGKINVLRSITLADGTTGEIKLDYEVPGFKLPLMITVDTYKRLRSKKDEDDDDNSISKQMMYL